MSVTRISNAKIIRNIEKLSDSAVVVGWFEETKYPDGTQVAMIAAQNEYGNVINHPGGTYYGLHESGTGRMKFLEKGATGAIGITQAHKIRIPPRPFVRPTVHKNKERWTLQTEKLFQQSIESGLSIESVMDQIGAEIKGNIQEAIEALVSPKLARSTIRRKGFDKPLIDTGLMLKSIAVKVGDK